MSNKIIEIKSRYGDNRIIEEIAENTLKITGKSHYMREIFDDDKKIHAIDFEGGPFIQVGQNIEGHIITEILYDQEQKCYLLKGEKQ